MTSASIHLLVQANSVGSKAHQIRLFGWKTPDHRWARGACARALVQVMTCEFTQWQLALLCPLLA